jgi:hypothetical protein
MVGTPLMPVKSVDTYLFALYDEDLKPGPGFERSFRLLKTGLTMVYDVGLSTEPFGGDGCFMPFAFSLKAVKPSSFY